VTDQEMDELLALLAEETTEYRAAWAAEFFRGRPDEAMEDQMNTLASHSYSE